MDTQEIRPGGTAAVGGDLGGLHQDHAEALGKDDELYPACGGGLGVEEAAATLGIAELEAHTDEEANAEHRRDAQDFFHKVVDRPVAEPRPALIRCEGLDIGLEPHQDAEKEAHHHQPVGGIDQRFSLEMGVAKDLCQHAPDALYGAVGAL